MVVGRSLRAAVYLVDGRTGRQVWSEMTDLTVDDRSDVADRIALRVGKALGDRLVYGEAPGLLLAPSLSAWKTFALGHVHADKQYLPDLRRLLALFETLKDVEGVGPYATTSLASMRVFLSWKHWTADASSILKSSQEMLWRLRSQHKRTGVGLSAIAWSLALQGNTGDALRYARQAVELTPENPFTHAHNGIVCNIDGRYAEALEKYLDAHRVRPKAPHWFYKERALALFCLGRYDDAIGVPQSLLVDEFPSYRDSNLIDPRMVYVASLAAAGREAEARHEAQSTLIRHPAASAVEWCRWQFLPFRDRRPAREIERLLRAAGIPAAPQRPSVSSVQRGA